MATIYGPQAWATTFSYPTYYQSSNHGGAGTPNANYPELASAENVHVVVGAGPNGENIVDAVNTLDYTIAGIALCGVGNGSLPTLQYDARYLVVDWWHKYKISGLAEAGHGQVLVLSDGGTNGDSGGLLSSNVFLSVETQRTAGNAFNYVLAYRRFTGSNTFSGTSRNPAAIIGSGVVDDAWHRLRVEVTPATVVGAFAGGGTLGSAVVVSNGAIALYVDNVLIGKAANINNVINYRATTNPAVYYGRGVWHGYSDLLGPVAQTWLYTKGPVPTDHVDPCCADAPSMGTGGMMVTSPDIDEPILAPFIPSCANTGNIPISATPSGGEAWS